MRSTGRVLLAGTLAVAGMLCTGTLWGIGTPESGVALAAAAAPRAKVLVVAIPQNPESLDPQNTVDAVSNTITRNIFDFLIRFDETMELKPALAESWEFKDDRTLVLRLRRGVKFHDGTPWNAQAAKMNLDRLRTEKLKRSDLIEPFVTSIEAIDEFSVQLNLKVPFAPIVRNLAHDAMGMVSPENLKKYNLKQIARQPAGTGPYIFEEWRDGDVIRLKPNPNYWGGAPAVAGLAFKVVPEPSVRAALMRAGEIDMISGVGPADADDLKKQAGIRVINKPSVNYVYLGLNTLRGPLQDKRVRQALNYATDKPSMIKTLLRGYALEADSPLPPAAWGHASLGKYPYDLAKARDLLRQAGFGGGFEFNLITPKGRYLMDYEVAQAIQASWKQIGVKVNLLTFDWGTLLSKVKQPPEKAEYDGFIINCGSRTGHASYCLSILYHSRNWAPVGSNRMYYKNERVDSLLDQVIRTVNEGRQLDLYKQIQQQVFEDAPAIFLYTENVVAALRDGLTGVEILPSEQYNFHRAAFTK